MSAFPDLLHRPSRTLLLSSGALALALAVGLVALRSGKKEGLQTRALEATIKGLDSKSLYYNGPARTWILQWRPDLLTDEDRDEKSARARGMAQAVASKDLFRQLDRKYRFDTLLLVGDPSQYRPLIEHLLEANDFALSYLDDTTLVYRRGVSSAWQIGELDALAKRIPDARARAEFFTQAAVRLLAIRRGADGKACLAKAEKLNDRMPGYWNGDAIYRMNRGEWTPALKSANRALEIDAKFLPALATKAQILYSTKKFSEAYDLSRRLIEAYPNEPALLFYHAKICHEAHAFTDEIRTLQKLIERADAESHPASGYRLYLAQAYAKDGKAQPAIDEFNRVLADANLSKEQRTFAMETMAQVKERAGIK